MLFIPQKYHQPHPGWSALFHRLFQWAIYMGKKCLSCQTCYQDLEHLFVAVKESNLVLTFEEPTLHLCYSNCFLNLCPSYAYFGWGVFLTPEISWKLVDKQIVWWDNRILEGWWDNRILEGVRDVTICWCVWQIRCHWCHMITPTWNKTRKSLCTSTPYHCIGVTWLPQNEIKRGKAYAHQLHITAVNRGGEILNFPTKQLCVYVYICVLIFLGRRVAPKKVVGYDPLVIWKYVTRATPWETWFNYGSKSRHRAACAHSRASIIAKL